MGIFVGIGNYIGGQPIGPNDYYIITEDGIAVLTERGKHILLDKYVTEDEIATRVKGRSGYDNIQITSDGEYDIPEYRNSSATSYPGFYLAGDNVNDMDCNIVVEEIPARP